MHLSRTLILGLIIGTAAMAQDTSVFSKVCGFTPT